MDHYSKRNIAFIILGMLVAGALTTWLTVVGVRHYLDSVRASDPLAKSGGPNTGKAAGSKK